MSGRGQSVSFEPMVQIAWRLAGHSLFGKVLKRYVDCSRKIFSKQLDAEKRFCLNQHFPPFEVRLERQIGMFFESYFVRLASGRRSII